MSMPTSKRKSLLLVLLMTGAGIFAPRAAAEVSLIFDFGGSSSTFAAPGDSISFDVYLQADPTDAMLAYEFYLQASGTAGAEGYFTITNRAASVVNFPDLYRTDAEVAAPSPGSTLQPRNTQSLGAMVTNFDEPVTGASLYFLATFTLRVSAAAIPGPMEFFITSVNTISGSGVGHWNDAEANEIPFASGGSLGITIVPEPAVSSLAAVGLMVLGRRRRQAGGAFARYGRNRPYQHRPGAQA